MTATQKVNLTDAMPMSAVQPVSAVVQVNVFRALCVKGTALRTPTHV